MPESKTEKKNKHFVFSYCVSPNFHYYIAVLLLYSLFYLQVITTSDKD